MNRKLKYILLSLSSLLLSLLLAELALRLFLDPVDFLKPRRVYDPVLRYAIEPYSGAHDGLGFRNRSVPARADIVAIGDSHTYGISARASDSWPSQLGRLTSLDVYNMSLGGYGPAEYFYLLDNKALGMRPELVIAGFYLGNDLIESFWAVYGLPHWESLRSPGFDTVRSIDEKADDLGSSGPGDWLRGHSLLYRLVSTSFIGDALRQRRREMKGERIIEYEDKASGVKTAFTPDIRLDWLDPDKPEVAEGLRLSLGFIGRMNELASQNGIRFIVLIIPTKESVYTGYLEGNVTGAGYSVLNELADKESVVRESAEIYFRAHGVEYIDMLPPLHAAARTVRIYPENFGGHTNKNGYRVIAETVRAYLDTH